MIELLLALTFWPWVLLTALFLTLTVSAYHEAVVVALIGLIVAIGIAWIFYSWNPFVAVANSPGQTVMLFVVYGAIGVGWSLFKWRNWMASERIQGSLKRAKKDYDSKDTRPEETFVNWYGFPAEAKASENKERIVSWIVLWPFSGFAYLFGEMLTQVFGRLYDLLAGTYQRITERYLP